MELTYDNLALHNLGELEISQTREYEGGENPFRVRVLFRVTLSFFERSYADNYSLILELREKLKVQHGQLKWTDPDTGQVWIDQPATVGSEDNPEEWGEYQQTATVVFQFFEHNLSNSSAPLTLTSGTRVITLDQVQDWTESYTAERFTTLHPERRTANIRMTCRGVVLANPEQTPAQRRTFLETKQADIRAKVRAAKEFTLALDAFSQAVRIETFETRLDQAATLMTVEFTAHYTAFPNEASFVIAEFTVTERHGNALGATGTGEQFLTLSAKVTAQSDAAASTRFNLIRASVLTAYGYTGGQLMDTSAEPSIVQADTDGERFLEKNFRLEYRKWRADNLAASFQRNGGSTGAKDLGKVTGFTHSYSARRFNDMRSQRQQATGRVSMKGVIPSGTPEASVASQRAILQAKEQGIRNEVNGADGRLVYGSTFNSNVRIEEFTADINQQLQAIEWSLTAVYTMFPNESGYATVEFSASTRDSIEDGDRFLMFNGRIMAQNEAAARGKLDVLRTTVLSNYDYTMPQQMRSETTASSVSANGDRTQGLSEASDGTTFIELTFAEEYRKRMADLLSYTMNISDSEETQRGFITTTYSGQVIATGATLTAAYNAALAKAQALGADKHPFLLRSVISWDQRKTQASAEVEFVRLAFTYEYQRKAGSRTYLELTSGIQKDTFGFDRETISGFISAADLATAQALYESAVKAGLADRMILGEQTGSSEQRLQGADAQFVQFNFQLELFKDKGDGATFRYELEVTKDWLNLTQTTTVSGACFAKDKATANAAIDAFIGTLQLGTSRESRRREDHGKVSDTITALFRVDFQETFDKRIEGEEGILECEVTEELDFSGVRWVEQPLPRNTNGTGGVSLFQDCGLTPGRRTVRGTVKAASQAVCEQWADDQRGLLSTAKTYEIAPQRSVAYVFESRVDGVVSGTGANVRMVHLAFTFAEWLPENAYVSPP